MELKILSERFSRLKGIISLVLFGSFARGDYGPRSDIDLLAIFEDDKFAQKVRKEIGELTKGLEHTPQIIIRSLKDLKETDTGLLNKIFREGKLLFLKHPFDFPIVELLQLKPYKIIVFKLKNLKPKDKRSFNVDLYGTISVKRIGKQSYSYKYKGLLDKIEGKKLGAGTLLVPEKAASEVEFLLKDYKIKYDKLDVWF